MSKSPHKQTVANHMKKNGKEVKKEEKKSKKVILLIKV